MGVPTDKDIRALHEKYAPTPEALDLVHTHCEIVWKIAEQLLARHQHGLNIALVRAGCLLHDIGVYRLYDDEGQLDQENYVRHGVLGYEVARREGLSTTVSRFCSRHTGVGITRHDVLAQGLPLPIDDYVAETDEENLVMYADKFHSKSAPPAFVSGDVYSHVVQRFGDDKVEAFRRLRGRFGEPDLAPLAAAYQHTFVASAQNA